MKNSFAMVVIGFLVTIFLVICYSVFHAVFSRCNNDSEQCERVADGMTPGGERVCVCTQGSHWIWQNDPMKKEKKMDIMPK